MQTKQSTGTADLSTNTIKPVTQHIIFGISGRAQSGKTTLANHIVKELQEEYGEITIYEIEILNFATYLKQILKDLFLIDDYYLNDDFGKTQKTQYKWKDLPMGGPATEGIEEEYVTGREIMEYFGSLFRRINPKAWINGVTSTIQNKVAPTIFIIPDVRSPNEVEAIHDLGGIVARLTLDPLKRDTLIEKSLDKNVFDWDTFDIIIDNSCMALETKNEIGLEKFLNKFDICEGSWT